MIRNGCRWRRRNQAGADISGREVRAPEAGTGLSKNKRRGPYLEREDIQASLEYAAKQVDHAVLSLAK